MIHLFPKKINSDILIDYKYKQFIIKTNMKILFISSRYYPHVGGVEEVVKSLAEEASKNNQVKIISSLDLSIEIKKSNHKTNKFLKLIYGFKLKSTEKLFGLYDMTRIWLNFPRSMMGWVSFPYRYIGSLFLLCREIKKFKPDVINYHFPDDSSFYFYPVMKFSKTPTVVNIHGNDIQLFYYKKWHKFFINGIIQKASKIVVNSEYMKNEVCKVNGNWSKKIDIIPNSIDTKYPREVEGKSYFKNPYVFFVGRMVYKKGIDILLKAFAYAKLKDYKILLEGSGEEFDEMFELVKDLGIIDKVMFTRGKLSTEQKFSYMKNAVFGVIPSRVEPFGIVALEMMAGGVPIIASYTGGLKSILKDRYTCLFFENRNLEDLAKKMKEMSENPELRSKLRKNALVEVNRYDNESIGKKYLNLFGSLIKK